MFRGIELDGRLEPARGLRLVASRLSACSAELVLEEREDLMMPGFRGLSGASAD